MPQTMETKYGAVPFDATNPREVLADRGRQMLIQAAIDLNSEGLVRNGDDLQHLIGGLLVGIAQVSIGHIEQTEDGWAAVRASLLQLAPWAVDMARSAEGLDPLPES